jgi:hypothetical protein
MSDVPQPHGDAERSDSGDKIYRYRNLEPSRHLRQFSLKALLFFQALAAIIFAITKACGFEAALAYLTVATLFALPIIGTVLVARNFSIVESRFWRPVTYYIAALATFAVLELLSRFFR